MSQLDADLIRQSGAAPRICLATKRGFSREAYQAALYEAEDVLASTSNVDLIDLKAGPHFALKNRWHRRLLKVYPGLAYANPGLQKVALSRDYDIFVAVCQSLWDLPHFNAIEGWKERSKVTVCWLDELWTSDIPKNQALLRSLERFDYVVVSCQGAVGPLSELLGRKCHLVPTGIDTLRFTPFPNPPDRSIDVYSIGRRWEGIHRALLGAASQQKLFYIYDSCRKLAVAQTFDHAQHRSLFASLAKRSTFFLVAPGKMNHPEVTQGQVEVGYRYFEGAAAGTVMIGQPVDCPLFRELFPWPDAAFKVNPDGSDVLDVIADLMATPERLAAISRRNAVEALLRHDWIHRWNQIFQIAGVAPSQGAMARIAHLKDLAQAATCTATSTAA